MAFNLKYEFKVNGREVCIRHRAPGGDFNKHLRVDPNNLGMPNMDGGQGAFARWKVHLEDGGSKCRVESMKNPGKYLRIKDGGNAIDVQGGTGPLTLFKIHKTGDGVVKLESNKFGGKYFAVQPKGPAVGSGGKWCDLKFLREGGGGGGGGAFGSRYEFMQKKRIVIQHKGGGNFNKFLRWSDGDKPDANGGKGNLAQWEAFPENNGNMVRLQNTKNGKYIRIKDGGNAIDIAGGTGPLTLFKVHKVGNGEVKLESNKFPGKYLAVGQNNVVRVGTGGPWCHLKAFK